ncbi:FAD-binding oxidoreductase [Helicobacter aurati]|uniref:D-lactate dehydrogenase (cytochrome) n=1 Tax=Helicobacter aurati TaxID=137778 RepID=A0A3D8J874_9HELI|nr:FAD-binding and (Fe-S)-binding domain-containing protein [Helicobacter aurati]RDU73061.1 FAD-binding oxidoreductase [Helicobacter aurati]
MGTDFKDFTGFINAAQVICKDRVYTDYLRLFAYGTDASCYRYIPKAVVIAHNESEIQQLFTLSQKFNVPLTFRAAGTSLSGQACSDNILVVANAMWKNIEITHNAESIFCDCGVIGSEANAVLKPFNKKIGPDPATLNNAMIGGIFSNNSSGMCCGTKQNSYQTIRSVRVILHDGSVLDTSERAKPNESLSAFMQLHKDKADALLTLRQEILDDKELCALIRRKFAIKNTTGYSLNALLDFDELKDILNHIFIGAEGTLAFVSKVEYECVEDYTHKACALLFYQDLYCASKAVEILARNEDIVSAAEIMDYGCLKAVRSLDNIDERIMDAQEGQCALLVQLEDSNKQGLESKITTITTALKNAPSLFGEEFSLDEKTQNSWWKIRKGLLPLSASMRPNRSVVITEDICFETQTFAQGIEKITQLFTEFNFEGIIFGHALSGNVHFIITPILDDEGESARFGSFMEAMVDSVIALGGSTKAEHGTGRMVAPFVEKEWGKKAYAMNQKIKAIFDSDNLINPDVIISSDPSIHLKNFKSSSAVEDFINGCMECGFCEKICPSKELSLTPRQRITIQREIARLQNKQSPTHEETQLLEELQRDYLYLGVETCATCSLCATLCPLEIDTAKIALQITPNTVSNTAKFIAAQVGKNLPLTLRMAKVGLNLANIGNKIFGNHTISKLSNKANTSLRMPFIPTTMPRSNNYIPQTKHTHSSPADRQVIYFSTCINRTFAPSAQMSDSRTLQQVFENVCAKANIAIIYPTNLEHLCCGKAFKNYPETSSSKASELYATLMQLTQGNNIDIVCDHSACSYELINSIATKQDSKNPPLKVYDMPQYIVEVLLNRLHITPLNEDIALYATCATKKGKAEDTLQKIAKACTNGRILVHEKTHCCGFAGNKGFSTPELNASALREFADFYANTTCKRGFSSSSTCEIGLSHHSGFTWQNLLYLVDETSTQKQ